MTDNFPEARPAGPQNVEVPVKIPRIFPQPKAGVIE